MDLFEDGLNSSCLDASDHKVVLLFVHNSRGGIFRSSFDIL